MADLTVTARRKRRQDEPLSDIETSLASRQRDQNTARRTVPVVQRAPQIEAARPAAAAGPAAGQSLAESPATPDEMGAADQSLRSSPQMQNVQAIEANRQAMAGAVPSPGDFIREDIQQDIGRAQAVGDANQNFGGDMAAQQRAAAVQAARAGAPGVTTPNNAFGSAPIEAARRGPLPANAGLAPQMDPAAAQAQLNDTGRRVATDPASVAGYARRPSPTMIQVGPGESVSQEDFIRTSNIMAPQARRDQVEARRRRAELQGAANALARRGDTAGATAAAIEASRVGSPSNATESARQVLSGEREMQLANQAAGRSDPRLALADKITDRERQRDERRGEQQTERDKIQQDFERELVALKQGLTPEIQAQVDAILRDISASTGSGGAERRTQKQQELADLLRQQGKSEPDIKSAIQRMNDMMAAAVDTVRRVGEGAPASSAGTAPAPGSGGAAAAPTPTPAPAAAAPTATMPDGRKITVRGGVWVFADTGQPVQQ